MADKTVGNNKSVIYATLLLSVVHWTFFALQMVTLPYVIKDLQLDNVDFGYIQTTMAVVQMIGNPIFSHFCTTHMKLSLAIAYASSALSYFLSSISGGFAMLILSRVVCLMMQQQIGLQTVISTVTTTEERTVWFSKLGATFGIGFVLGSILGGSLTNLLGYYVPSFVGGVFSLLAIPLIYAYLPDESHDTGVDKKGGEKSVGMFAHYARLLSVRQVFVVLLSKNLCLIPTIIFTTIFGLYLVEEHNISPGENAILSVYVGVSMILMNAVGISVLRKKYPEYTLLYMGFGLSILNGIGLVLVSAYWHFFIVMPILATSMTLVSTVCDSLMTTAVKPVDHALVVGLAWALDSVVRVVGPTIAGYMLSDLGFKSFGLSSIAGPAMAWALFSVFSQKIEPSLKVD